MVLRSCGTASVYKGPMIPVDRPEDADLEPCAVRGSSCRGLTTLWTALPDRQPKDQVACCSTCSVTCEPEDVPSKAEWFKRTRRRCQ